VRWIETLSPIFTPAHKSLSWFGFGGSTVLVVSSGHQVSFYTTVGGDVLLKDIIQLTGMYSMPV
jgi:hypothetical protein